MTRTGLRLAVLAAFIYFVGLVVMFPASLVVRWFVPDVPGLVLGAVQGTAWRGRIENIEYQGFPAGQLQWQLHPLALLALRANADIEVRREGGNTIFAFVSARPDGSMDIRGLRGTVTLGDLERAQIIPRNMASGDLMINMDSVRVRDGRLQAAEGRLGLAALRMPLMPDDPLGSYTADVTTEENTIMARFQQLEAPLEVAGTASVQPDGRYAVSGSIMPTRETPEMIRRGMAFLGSPDRAGRYPFSFEGTY